jgi:hypothetical protein
VSRRSGLGLVQRTPARALPPSSNWRQVLAGLFLEQHYETITRTELDMQAVDMNHVQFWRDSSLNPSFHRKRTALPYGDDRSVCATTPRTQPALQHNKADQTLKRHDRPKSAVAATRQRGDDFGPQHEHDAAEAKGTVREYATNESCLIC